MRHAIVAASALISAACQGSDLANSEAATLLQPGEWELTSSREYGSTVAPGQLDGELRVYSKEADGPRTCYYCLTAEAAARPNATLLIAQEPADCRVDNVAMAGGRIGGQLDCGVSRANLSGRYTPTEYQLTGQLEWTGIRDPRSPDIREVRINGRRIGECPRRRRDLSQQC